MPHASRRLILLRVFVLVACTLAGNVTRAAAQAGPTAGRAITPSVFAGVSGVYTGLNSGRNLSFTAGLDVTFRTSTRLYPALEYRATYAFDKGHVDSIDNNLLGLKLYKNLGRFDPYLDLLAGRGETTYADGGYQVPGTPIFYTQSASNVYSFGGGADVLAAGNFALKIDLQLQRYSSPVTPSGHLYSEVGTIGVVYIFRLGRSAIR